MDTRRTTRRDPEEEVDDTPTAEAGRSSRAISEPAASRTRGATAPPLPPVAEVEDDSEREELFEDQDEADYIANLTEQQLQKKIEKAEVRVNRTRQEKRLLALRKEIRGEGSVRL